MADKTKAFMNCIAAKHVREGYILGGVGDLFKSEWKVDKAEVLDDGQVSITMTCGGRTVTKATPADEVLFRLIIKNTLGSGYEARETA